MLKALGLGLAICHNDRWARARETLQHTSTSLRLSLRHSQEDSKGTDPTEMCRKFPQKMCAKMLVASFSGFQKPSKSPGFIKRKIRQVWYIHSIGCELVMSMSHSKAAVGMSLANTHPGIPRAWDGPGMVGCLLFSGSVVSDSLQPHGMQHARLLCPSCLPEFVHFQVHCVCDDISPSYPLPPSSPFDFNLSQHQGLFQGVGSSHQVAKVLELQLQHQLFQ